MITKEKAIELRKIIEKISTNLSDEDALKAIELFSHWSPDSIEYTPGDRVNYKNILYKCIGSTSHISQSNWSPDVSPSLWVRVDNPAEEWPEWIQPLGATDAYPEGAKVSHNNNHWISTVSANIWEPGVYGWQLS